jgi:predicted ester cyclase
MVHFAHKQEGDKMSTPQPPEKNKETVRKLYEEIINTGKLELLDQIIAEDYVGIYGQKGPSAYAETIKALRQGFPDIQWTIEDLVAAEDRVAVRWTWRGTHKGQYRGFLPSQKQITDKAIAIYQFRGDKIVHAWIETDRLGLLQQIGAVPPDLGSVPQLPTKSS